MNKFFRSRLKYQFLRLNKKCLKVLQLEDNQQYNKEQLKKQYYKLAKKYHPDQVQSQQTFLVIKEAYEKLLKEIDQNEGKIHNSNNNSQYSQRDFRRFYKPNYDNSNQNNFNEQKQNYQQQNFYYQKTYYQNYDILDNKYFQALEVFTLLLLLLFTYYRLSYFNGKVGNTKLTRQQIKKIIKERNENVQGLKEFTNHELDMYDTSELIQLEQDGYKKIPDQIYKNILMIHLNEISKRHNQLIMSDNSLNQEQGKNQQKQESKKKRRPRSAVGERNYLCGCSKAYLSYPALYTHVKNKHGGVFPIGSNAKRKIQKNDEENLDELFTQDLESFYEEFQDFVQEANANSNNKEQKIKPNLIEQLFEKIQLKNHEWEKVFKEQITNQSDNKTKKEDLTIYQVFSNYLNDIFKYCSEKFFREYFYLIYMFSECINKYGHHFIDLEDEKENTEKLFCMGNQILVISRMTNLFIAEHFLEKFKEMQEKEKKKIKLKI